MANPNPTPFKKTGADANPNGRPPKGYSITETIREMMDNKPEIKQALAQKILQKALSGDKDAIKLLWNYLEGMPIQKSELSGSDGKDVAIKLITYGSPDTPPLHGETVPDTLPPRGGEGDNGSV